MRVALAALIAFGSGCGGEPEREWVTVTRGDLVVGVEITGSLKAVDSTPMRPPPIPNIWRFKVAHMAEEGEKAAKGDVVLRFDTSELRQRLASLKNSAERAETQIRQLRSDAALRRQNDELAIKEQKGAVKKLELKAAQPVDLRTSLELKTTAIDLQIARLDTENVERRAALSKRNDASQMRALRNTFERSKKRIEELEASIAKMNAKAPRAGTVIHAENWGSKVKVGETVWVMRSVIEIVSLDKMIAEGMVDEVDSSKVKEGQPVSLRADAHPDDSIRAKVTKIGDSFRGKSRTDRSKVIDIELSLDDTGELALRPGMRFRGEIETDKIEGTLLVPADAVVVTPKGPVVHKRDGDGIEVSPVEIGAQSSEQIEIVSGLSEGDQIAIPGTEAE